MAFELKIASMKQKPYKNIENKRAIAFLCNYIQIKVISNDA